MNQNDKDNIVTEAFNTLDIKKLQYLYDEMSQGKIQIPIAYTMFFMEFDIKKESYQKKLNALNDSLLEFNEMSLFLDKTGPIECLEKIQKLFLKSLDKEFLHTIYSILDKQDVLKSTSFYEQVSNEILSRKIKPSF